MSPGVADAPVSRNDLMQQLLDQGIATRRGIMLAHREPAYAGYANPVSLVHSEDASARSLLMKKLDGNVRVVMV